MVQLGAYGSPQRVLSAWNKCGSQIRRAQELHSDERAIREPKGTFYRLSVRGFSQRPRCPRDLQIAA